MSDLFTYTLRIADNPLILGQRLGEWCGHGPVLEQDIAMTNISLDLIGQATNLLDYAALIQGQGLTHDDLAFKRDAIDFRNLLLTEQPNTDFGYTVARQFLYDAYIHPFYTQLASSTDQTLAAIAAKSLKEVSYHLRWSSEWMIRLGDGTPESHSRVQDALNELWQYTGEMFAADQLDDAMLAQGIGADLQQVKREWTARVDKVLSAATLDRPQDAWMQGGGRHGRHTEHLGFILADMQFMQRAYPGLEW